MWSLKLINPIKKIIGGKTKNFTKKQIVAAVHKIKRDSKSKNLFLQGGGYYCSYCGLYHDMDDPAFEPHFWDGAPEWLQLAAESELAKQEIENY